MSALGWTRSGLVVAVCALLLPLLFGVLRARGVLSRQPPPLVAASSVAAPAPKIHDPTQPTVAVVLAADISEITDVLGPYEMFARAGGFNVYAVAPAAASTALTGGLRLRPHHSLAELDRLLEGRAPEIVVAPNLPNLRSPANRPVVDWVRRSARAGATIFSWCAGAAVLAEAGLLDGRTATSHWGDLARLEREYPRVVWQRGVRWIDHGNVVMSAGITSGIDATLRLLTRLRGEEVARRVASELRYPNFHFALSPRVEQYSPRLTDAVLFLNAAFEPARRRIGLALYDGVGELDVSAVYDAHAATAVAEVSAVAAAPGLVRTAHGLWLEPALVPERDAHAVALLDRVIVPGVDAPRRGASVTASVRAVTAKAPEFLQAGDARRFALEPILEDLARTADRTTATFARRRLEYRSSSLRLEGSSLPLPALLLLVSLCTAGALLAGVALRWRALARQRTEPRPGVSSSRRRGLALR